MRKLTHSSSSSARLTLVSHTVLAQAHALDIYAGRDGPFLSGYVGIQLCTTVAKLVKNHSLFAKDAACFKSKTIPA